MNDAIGEQTRLVVEALFCAGKQGDVGAILSLLDADIVVHEPTFLPYGGRYEGRDSFLRLFALIKENYFDDDLLEIDYIAVSGPNAVVIARAPGKHGEEVMLAEEMRVQDGKVVEVRIYMHRLPHFE